MNVAVIYPYIPHYRQAVFTELARAPGGHQFVFFAGENSIETSIRSQTTSNSFELRSAPIRGVGPFVFQFGLLRAVLGREFQALIFLGNPYFASTWIYALLARLRGKHVSFWTHGWLVRERGLRGWFRNLFYSLAHSLLLYGDRAKSIGQEIGFDSQRLHVIYNSLDYELQLTVRRHLESLQDPREALPPELRKLSWYAASIARLTDKCRFDLAIDALADLESTHGIRLPFVLIGDGPARAGLAEQAKRRNVPVVFLGEMYDENLIGAILYNARMVLSPGKLGLTGMHSLAYGVPVVTHDAFHEQMPEYEAVVPGVTGAFFEQGNVRSLMKRIHQLCESPQDSSERSRCIRIVEERYTPARQAQFIEHALKGCKQA